MTNRVFVLWLATLFWLLFQFTLNAINLPPEFEDVLILEDLLDPASMAFSPDGRLFLGERISGQLRVAQYDAVTDEWIMEAEPFFTFNVPIERHRSSGLRGFAFDPNFASNGYVYAFYMQNNPRHNRVVRIQADPQNPNIALANSETVLIELPFNNSTSSGSHNGGDIAFGADGKLYFTTGDGWNGGDDVQNLETFTGKLFRINADGSIPNDNPFYNQAAGDYRAIYALGLRNPYTMAVHPATGDVYINEARGTNKADVYQVLGNGNSAAANFGHDGYDGIGTVTNAWTNVSSDGGKLVTGGAWYPSNGYWPDTYLGNYFTVLWGGNGSSTDGRIVRVYADPNNPTVETFATEVFMSPGRHKPVMCKIGPDQNLYYLLTDYETGGAQIRMIQYTGVAAVAAPSLLPPPGQYDDPQTIQISTTTPNATIYYTLDGSIPTINDQLYTNPITLSNALTLRAIAEADGFADSPVSGGAYIIGPVPNIPPVADAGPDVMVAVGTEVTLNGAASYDPDGSPLEIVEEWIQLSGPTVTIQDADETVANFTPTELGVYTFQLSVTDVLGAIDQDEVVITVVESIPDVLDGLIARWRMEAGVGNIIADYSDNSNIGMVEGPLWEEETPDGSSHALGFDGVDDRVSIGNLDVNGDAMSITFWFKANSFNVHDARFISKASGQNDPDHYWMVSTLNGSQLRFRLQTNGNTTTLISDPGVLSTGTWIHVAAVYDGNEMQLFVDGEWNSSTAANGNIDSEPSVGAAIGNQPANASGGLRPFHGLMDEVRIYGKALTPEEVLTVMQSSTVITSTGNLAEETPTAVYPSPVEDLLQITWAAPLTENKAYQLLNSSGAVVKSGRINQGQTSLSIAMTNLTAGIYIFQWTDRKESYKVIKY